MTSGSDDLGKKSVGELIKMLRPRQLWSTLTVIAVLCSGSFFLGRVYEEIITPCPPNDNAAEIKASHSNKPKRSVADQSFEITVSALNSSIIELLGGVTVKLNNTGEHNDELLFDGIIGRAESPIGPFISDEDRGGSKYWDGQQFFVQLRTGKVWKVSVGQITRHTINLVFVAETGLP